MRADLEAVTRTPHIFRRAGGRPMRRELVIPFSGTGYVALYEIAIAIPTSVLVLAVRHQRDGDYR